MVPTMPAVIAMTPIKTPTATTFKFNTWAGKRFTMFAKNKEWNNGAFVVLCVRGVDVRSRACALVCVCAHRAIRGTDCAYVQ
jgi:hypothetical protein